MLVLLCTAWLNIASGLPARAKIAPRPRQDIDVLNLSPKTELKVLPTRQSFILLTMIVLLRAALCRICASLKPMWFKRGSGEGGCGRRKRSLQNPRPSADCLGCCRSASTIGLMTRQKGFTVVKIPSLWSMERLSGLIANQLARSWDRRNLLIEAAILRICPLWFWHCHPVLSHFRELAAGRPGPKRPYGPTKTLPIRISDGWKNALRTAQQMTVRFEACPSFDKLVRTVLIN